jgi:hypothetical protein
LVDDITSINRDEYPIKSFEDLEQHKEKLKTKISEYLLK